MKLILRDSIETEEQEKNGRKHEIEVQYFENFGYDPKTQRVECQYVRKGGKQVETLHYSHMNETWRLDSPITGFDFLVLRDSEPEPPSTPQSVWIVWGEALMEAEPTRYDFDTLAELNAFLKGIDEGNGWMDWYQANTEQEALDHIKGRCGNPDCEDDE